MLAQQAATLKTKKATKGKGNLGQDLKTTNAKRKSTCGSSTVGISTRSQTRERCGRLLLSCATTVRTSPPFRTQSCAERTSLYGRWIHGAPSNGKRGSTWGTGFFVDAKGRRESSAGFPWTKGFACCCTRKVPQHQHHYCIRTMKDRNTKRMPLLPAWENLQGMSTTRSEDRFWRYECSSGDEGSLQADYWKVQPTQWIQRKLVEAGYLCCLNMVISSTVFRRKNIYKITWISLDLIKKPNWSPTDRRKTCFGRAERKVVSE